MTVHYELPLGWSFPTIGELASAERGAIRIGPFGSALKKHEYATGGVRVLGIEDVFPNRLVAEKRKYISERKFRELSQYSVSAGDLLVTNMGTVGRTCVVPDDLERSIISSHLIKVSLNSTKAWSPYVSWMLNSCPVVIAQIREKSHGAIMAGFNSGLLTELRIPLPPLGEQHRIADALDKVDALRAKRRDALAQLDTLPQAVFTTMFGDAGENERGWPIRLVSDYVAEFLGGRSIEAESGANVLTRNRVLRVSAVTGMRFIARESKPVPDTYTPPQDHFVRGGDLLFSRANTTSLVGAVAIVNDTPANLLLPDKLWRFIWRTPITVEPLFVWALFQTPAIRREIARRATGTSGSMKNISQEKVLNIPTIVPALDAQRAFATRLRHTEKLRAAYSSSLMELEALFASVQDRALAGEL